MKQQDKTKLGRRDFLRAMGAGAGVAVTAAAPLATEAIATETDAEKKKARYQANSDRRAELLQSQSLSELRETEPC